MTDEQAQAIAEAWRAAWNSHDPERVIAHYAGDVTYFSPFIEASGTRPAGELSGRDALREYAASAFDRFPELHFDAPLQVGAGSSRARPARAGNARRRRRRSYRHRAVPLHALAGR